MSYKGSTQTLSDSTKIPDVHLNKVLRAAKVGNEYKRLNENYKNQLSNKQQEITLLERRIYVKDTTISHLQERVELNRDSYEKMQGIYNLERVKHIDTKNEFDAYRNWAEKEMKSLNRRKNLNKLGYGVGGVILGTAVGIIVKSLFIK